MIKNTKDDKVCLPQNISNMALEALQEVKNRVTSAQLFDLSIELLLLESKLRKKGAQQQILLINNFRKVVDERIRISSCLETHQFVYQQRALFAKSPDGKKAIFNLLKEGFAKFENASSEIITIHVTMVKQPRRSGESFNKKNETEG